MALPQLGGGSSPSPAPRSPRVVERRAARVLKPPPKPVRPPVVRAPVVRPAPAPKPPPVVVSNNQGQYSRPKPPPPVKPGNIQGAGGGNRGNNNRPRNTPQVKPPDVAVPTQTAPAPTDVPVVAAAPVEAPAPPGVDEWLGTDTDYQGQLGQFGSALTGFQTEQQTRKQQAAASFAQRLRQLQEAQKADETDLHEDFASRGLSSSGVYGSALSDLQRQYLDSQTNLQSEQTSFDADLAQQLANYQAEQQALLDQARMDAIARRAAQYGL